MSLHHLLPPEGVEELLARWPDEPRVYDRGSTALDTVTADRLWEHIHSGCVPPDDVRALKGDVPSITAAAFSSRGRVDGTRLRGLHERGYTVRLGHLQRVMPEVSRLCRDIQGQTGCSTYASAFLTPAGQQGLKHHWDQQLVMVAQLEGVKRWQLWRPVVEAPTRDVHESWRVWQDDYLRRWEETSPDQEVDLQPGQTLVLPRGWVHNPFVPPGGSASAHVTVAVLERTPFWLAEQMLTGAIQEPELRRVILPGELYGDGLPARLGEVRDQVVEYLAGVDLRELAERVREVAGTDVEYVT